MANLLQSSQNQATVAPSYYTDYLSGLAQKGSAAADAAQFAGAQPLQLEAFNKAQQNFGDQQQAFQTGQGYVGQAAGQNVTGAAAPYLQAGTSASPLNAMQPYATQAMCNTGYEAATPLVSQGAGMSGLASASPYLQSAATSGGLSVAQPYLQKATGTSPADLAAQYMNPYIDTAVQSMSDIAQRNIRNNLSPAATAAAVGSGQFGSQRGAQVLGQIKEQANQDLNSQIAQMLSSGYGQALCAAGKQNALTASAGQTAGTLGQQQASLLGQIGQTAGTLTGQQAQNLITAGSNLGNLQQGANQIAAGLGQTASAAQQAQNTANLQAGATAAQAAANQGQLLNTAGANMGALGTAAGTQNLACINALATLGGQQQTIAQNAQNYPLTKLASLASLLQGYSIPTTTKTTLCMSPLSGISAVGAIAKGVACSPELSKAVGSMGTSIGGWLDKMNTGSGSSGGVDTYNGIPLGCMPVQECTPAITDEELQRWSQTPDYVKCGTNSWCYACCESTPSKRGGLIQAKAVGGSIGSLNCKVTGGMPSSDMCSGMICHAGAICTPYQMARGGLAKMIRSGNIGCMSTKTRGALPFKKG